MTPTRARAKHPLVGARRALYGERMRRASILLLALAACFNPPGQSGDSSSGSGGVDTGASSSSGGSSGAAPDPTTGATGEPTTTSSTTSSTTTTGDATSDTGASGSSDDTGPAALACGEYTPGLDLEVCTATYLGGPGLDLAGGVAIGLDDAIVVGGSFPGHDFFGALPTVIDAGDGAIFRLAPDGRALLSMVQLGGAVVDVDVDSGSGWIAAVGEFGAIILAADGVTEMWSDPTLVGSRVAIGDDGWLAVLTDDSVAVRDPVSAAILKWPIATSDIESVADVALHAPSKSILVAGTRARAAVGPCMAYQMPFIHSYSYAGVTLWRAYDHDPDAAAAAGLCATARAHSLSVGRDGKLYYAGAAGGRLSAHVRLPSDPTLDADNHIYDAYNDYDSHYVNGVTIGYYARLDPVFGGHQGGQFVLARRTKDEPASKADAAPAWPVQISALIDGTMVIVGVSSFELASRSQRTIEGVPVGAYDALEPFVLIVAPDFSVRHNWAPFTGTGPGDARGVAVGESTAAALLFQTAEQLDHGALRTVDALRSEPASLDGEVHLAVFPAAVAGD